MDQIYQVLGLNPLKISQREEEFIRGLFHLEGESFLRLKHKCESQKLTLTQDRKKWIKDHKVSLSKIVAVVQKMNEARQREVKEAETALRRIEEVSDKFKVYEARSSQEALPLQIQNLDILQIPQIINSCVHEELYQTAADLISQSLKGILRAKFNEESFSWKFREEITFLKELLKRKLKVLIIQKIEAGSINKQNELNIYLNLCRINPKREKSQIWRFYQELAKAYLIQCSKGRNQQEIKDELQQTIIQIFGNSEGSKQFFYDEVSLLFG